MLELKIVEAERGPSMDHAVSLMRDYRLWVHRLFAADPDVLEGAFDAGEWESELADLPAHYGAPHGAILLALVKGVPVGCALMRGIGAETCEIRRLFVRPAFRGHGIARCLIVRAAQLAAVRGYRSIRATAARQHVASQRVLLGVGFVPAGVLHGTSRWRLENMAFFKAHTSDVAAQDCAPQRRPLVAA